MRERRRKSYETRKRLVAFLLAFMMILSSLGVGGGSRVSFAAEPDSNVATATDSEEKTEQVTEATTEKATVKTTEAKTEKSTESTEQITTEVTTEAAPTTPDVTPAKRTDKFNTWAEAQSSSRPAALAGDEVDPKEGFSNFAPYLKEHTITVDNKTVASGSVVDPSQSFSLSLKFAMTIDDMAANGLKYYYELPEHISIGNIGSASKQITLYNSRKVAIATYYVLDDVMYVTFPGYYETVTTNFSQGASWVECNNLSQIPVDWGTDQEVFLIDNCDLKVVKNSSGYRTDKDGNITNAYKVTVKPKTSGVSIDDITFVDTLSTKYMQLKEDVFGDGQDIKVTYYTEAGDKEKEEYYKHSDVTTGTKSPYKTTITPINIENGGYFTVEYTGIIPVDDRYEFDAHTETEQYTNVAKASYPYTNPTTGETETVSAEVKIDGTYKSSNEWIYKSADSETKTKYVNGDTKIVVPYAVSINMNRLYSLGGGIVNDVITGFGDGDVKKDVVYYTDPKAETYVIATDKRGERRIDQKWVKLDDATYNQLAALHGITSTQLEALRANSALQATVVNAINSQYGTSFGSMTDEAALSYVFTTESQHNFVWFMPLDDTPTTYMIHYSTLVDSQVGEYSNSANLWYTEIEGYPGGPGGVGWEKPVKKVLNATKKNAGIRIDAQGRYFVDYTVTVGLEPGSAGFYDIFVVDNFPSYSGVPIGDDGTKATVYDWIYVPSGEKLEIYDAGTTTTHNNEIIKSLATFSTTSTDPAVQKIVQNARVMAPSGGRPVNRTRGSLLPGEGSSTDMDILFNGQPYKGKTTPAGQFTSYANTNLNGKGYNYGDTYSLTKLAFLLGNLPGTEEGYDIDINYTLQINPCLVEAVDEIIKEKKLDYLTNQNTAYVNTSVKESDGTYTWSYSSYSGTLNRLSSSYWIGRPEPEGILNKDVLEYDKTDRLLKYRVEINNEETLGGVPAKYEIRDSLNISGLNYKDKSVTLFDKENKIIYTNEAGKSVDPKYAGLASFEITSNKTAQNHFVITLDNENEKFMNPDGTLISMTLDYGVDFTNDDSDVTLMNTVNLRAKFYDPKTDLYYDELIDEDVSEYAVDKAVNKGIINMPSLDNGYTAQFYVDVDPSSDNAKQLKEKSVGDKFTVVDKLSSALRLEIDSVKVFEIADGTQTDVTDSTITKYDLKTNEFTVDITIGKTNAKYRVVYETAVSGKANGVVEFNNVATVKGTDIKEDIVQEKTFVPEFNESADGVISKIRLQKFDQYNTDKKVKATFDLYVYDKDAKKWILLTDEENDGYKKVRTDEKGVGYIDNDELISTTPLRKVMPGRYFKLVEVETEEGYMLDTTPIYYYVAKDPNDHPSVSGISDVAKFDIVNLSEAGATTSELPLLRASNHKLSFDIKKIDGGTLQVIGGAEFSLYTDEACTDLVATSEEKNGVLAFNDVTDQLDTVLYMKETKFPTGYLENDYIYKLTFEKGFLKTATYMDNEVEKKLTFTKTTERSTVTVRNLRPVGNIVVKKTVVKNNGSTTRDLTDMQFAFSVKLTNPDGSKAVGTLDGGKFQAVIIDENGNENPFEYMNESVFYLKDKEQFAIRDLEAGIAYTVKETLDNTFTTSISTTDNVGKDSKYGSNGVISGTIDVGGNDTVTVTNTALQELMFVKTSVSAAGEIIPIPDGQRIAVCKSSTYNTSEILVEVKWSEELGKYVVIKKGDTKYDVDTSIPNGFFATGLPNGKFYVFEYDADIDGMALNVSYRKSKSLGFTNAGGAAAIESGSYQSNYCGYSQYVEIKNVYSANYTEVKIPIKKVYNNGTLEGGEFSFEISEKTSEKGTFAKIATVTNDADGNINVPKRLTKTGTYYFMVKEVLPTDATYRNGYKVQGIKYQTDPVYFTVEVTKDEDGEYVVGEPVFTNYNAEVTESALKEVVNSYLPEGVFKPDVKKYVKNKYVTSKLFKVSIAEYESDYTTPKLDADGEQIVYVGTNNDTIYTSSPKPIVFDPIKYGFDDIGSHYYIVSEVIPEDKADRVPGFIYDETQYKLQIDVSDDTHDGNLTVTPIYEKDDAGEDKPMNFTNVYDEVAEVTFEGSKIINDKDIAEDEFLFEVTQYTNSSRTTVKTDKEGNPCVYICGTDTTAVDPDTKKTTAKIKYPTFKFSRYIDGYNNYNYYRITEKIPVDAVENELGGVKYIERTYDVTLYVSSNSLSNGTLDYSFLTTYDGEEPPFDFTNEYKADGTLQFTGTKAMKGRDLLGSTYDFEAELTVTEADGTKAAPTIINEIGKSTADGDIVFKELSFDNTDIGRTYTYAVSETIPAGVTNGADGVTYSAEVFTVDVKVVDGGSGTLAYETKVTDADGNVLKDITDAGDVNLVFTNLYNADCEVAFVADKSLTGKDLVKDQFNFEIVDAEGTVVSTGTNDADGKIAFAPIKYAIASTPDSLVNQTGEHKYTVRETVDKPAPGYTYDSTTYDVAVTVTDNLDGTLGYEVEGATKVTAPDGSEVYEIEPADGKSSTFENMYETTGSIRFAGSKTLTGLTTTNTRDIQDGEFTFVITEYTDDTYSEIKKNADGDEITYTATNDADGKILYDEIKYTVNATTNDVGKHYYIITEADNKAGGVTYSTDEIKVTVDVADNGEETLDVTSTDDYSNVSFDNYYSADGAIKFTVKKAAEDKLGNEYKNEKPDKTKFDRSFEFELYENDTLLDTKSCNVGESVEFDSVAYNLDDIGSHEYKIIEKDGDEAGFEYDTKQYDIKVNVSDNGDGTLKTDVEGGLPELVFVNTYDASGSIILKGKKSVLNIKEMLDGFAIKGGEFKFEIYEVNEKGENLSADKTPLATASNDANGIVTFGEIPYTASDIGTHKYRIDELREDEIDSIVYGDSIYVDVKVDDCGDGKLVAKAVGGSDDIDFEFKNEATELDVDKKDSKGKALAGANLTILDKDGKTVYEFVSSDKTEVVYGLKKNVEYKVVETEAPEGYKLAEPVVFKINERNEIIVDGKVVDSIVIVDASLIFDDMDDDSDYNSDVDDTDIDTSDDDTQYDDATISDATSTDATPTDATIKGETTDKDKTTNKAKTGDDMNLPLAMLVLITSAFMAAFLGKKRRDLENDN